jgi:hypothetical protein
MLGRGWQRQRVWGDPGPCPICGVAHTACTPQRAPTTPVPVAPPASEPRPSFTLSTYKRPKKKKQL